MPPKEPQISTAIDPGRCLLAASRSISSGSRSQRAVDARLETSVRPATERAASAHPGPQIGGGIVFPQVVELAPIPIQVIAVAPEEPEMAAGVGPGGCTLPV